MSWLISVQYLLHTNITTMYQYWMVKVVKATCVHQIITPPTCTLVSWFQ